MSINKFILIPLSKYYKIYQAFGNNYIRNTKTGEDMGKIVRLKVYFYDEQGNRLQHPQYEEDCYEYAQYPLS